MKQEIQKPNKSYVIIEEPTEEDFLFGSLQGEILVEDGDWKPYLPSNEKQRRGFESMCCTNFSSTSTVETYMTYLIKKGKISVENMEWLEKNGYFDEQGNINFSDRFDAIMSGTGPNGNSLKNPAQAKHKYGLISESMLPWTDDRNAYFNKDLITQEMLQMGQDFLQRFQINYERVNRDDFEEALKFSPLAGACFAWNGANDGVFYRVKNGINHAIEIIKPPAIWNIFDSYDPYIKKLANNYIFLGYAYRYLITETGYSEPKKKDMINLKKFQTDPKVYLQSNTNPKELIWVGNEKTFEFMRDKGWVGNWSDIEVLDDSLKPNYDISSGVVLVNYILNALVNLLGGKKLINCRKANKYMEKKWYKSKTIWGIITSALGTIAIAVASFYSTDISEIVRVIGVILNAFGVPFAINGRVQVGKALAGKK